METRHPVEGLFGLEFAAFVIVAELWRREIARPEFFLQFLRFWKNDSLGSYCIKFSKFCSESLHGDTDWRCVEMS